MAEGRPQFPRGERHYDELIRKAVHGDALHLLSDLCRVGSSVQGDTNW